MVSNVTTPGVLHRSLWSMDEVVDIAPNFGGIGENFFYVFGSVVVVGGFLVWLVHTVRRRK